MKNIFLPLIIVFTLSLFASCEKELEYRGEYLDPIITITSFNNIYDTLYCNISKTNFFLEDNDVWIIDNPAVRYSINGGEWQDMVSAGVSETGYSEQFISNYVIQPDDEVALEVSHPDYPTATSAQIAPQPIKITLEKLERVDLYTYTATAIFYPYDGQTEEETIYQFSIGYILTEESLIDSTINYYIGRSFTTSDLLTLQLYGDDTSYFTSGVDEESYGDLSFLTSLITEPYEFTFNIDLSSYYWNFYDWENYDYNIEDLDVFLSVIPASYYKYGQTKYSSMGESMFSEKVQLYNNIEDGVGNFTIYSSAVDSLSIAE